MIDALRNDPGNVIISLIIFYLIVKWVVKNGIKEAHKDIKLEKSQYENKNE